LGSGLGPDGDRLGDGGHRQDSRILAATSRSGRRTIPDASALRCGDGRKEARMNLVQDPIEQWFLEAESSGARRSRFRLFVDGEPMGLMVRGVEVFEVDLAPGRPHTIRVSNWPLLSRRRRFTATAV